MTDHFNLYRPVFPAVAMSIAFLLPFAAMALSPAPAPKPKALPAPAAHAALADASGKAVGALELYTTAHGLLARLDGHDLPIGWHGMHFHQKGSCADAAAGFKESGSHAAHDGQQHGVIAGKPHSGDLPNVHVGADGTVKADAFVTATLAELSDADGAAVILHQDADDYQTQPTGASGDRIACGVLKPYK